MFKYAIIFLLFCKVIEINTENSETSMILCETKMSDKCLDETLTNFIESVDNPMKDFVKSIKGKMIEDNNRQVHYFPETKTFKMFKNSTKIKDKETSIKCFNKDTVIKIVKASVSNVDKTKCLEMNSHLRTKSIDCTERINTTILATRMCNDKNQCTFSIDREFANLCECSPQKYLNLTYKCVLRNF